MAKFIMWLVAPVAMLASMLMGIFAAMGLCATIWGPSILDTALGSPPERSHPAFITFMLVMVPAMLLCLAGGVSAIILPLFVRFDIRCAGSLGVAKFMRNHAIRILRVTGDKLDDSTDGHAA